MARRIVKQPDGLLSVWSTIVDNFIITDATKEETQIVQFWRFFSPLKG